MNIAFLAAQACVQHPVDQQLSMSANGGDNEEL
jgi:hypothetical protein